MPKRIKELKLPVWPDFVRGWDELPVINTLWSSDTMLQQKPGFNIDSCYGLLSGDHKLLPGTMLTNDFLEFLQGISRPPIYEH